MRVRIVGTTACSDEEHLRQGAAAAFAHDHDDLALAGPVLSQPAVDPVGSQVFRPDMAAEPGAVNLGNAPRAADAQPLHAGCDRLAQLMRQHEDGVDGPNSGVAKQPERDRPQ